jgi:hypothetical protein
MIGFTLSSRIGGRATGTRRCAPRWAMAVAFAASVAVLAIGGVNFIAPIGAVLAQTPGTAGPLTFDLFTGDSVDLNPKEAQRFADAARKAQAPGECPLGRFTIFVPKGDPLFQQAMGAARRDAVLKFLNGQGITPSRFFADVTVGGTQNNVQLDLNAARDDIPPTLDVTWTPPKGTKVKANQRITAKAVARDDANRWQIGINTIDLNVDGGGSFGFEDFPRPPRTCERPPPPRTLDGVYTVPANPPPLVRLHAIAKDYAGNETDVWAEFPTGDWYGTFEAGWDSVVLGVRTTLKDHMDIVLEYDGKGNLEGTLVGNRSFNVQNHPNCNWATTVPNKLRGKLVGSYTPGAEVMSIQLVEPVDGPMPRKDCPGGGYIISGYGIHEWPPFKSILGSPRAAGDGTFQSSREWSEGPFNYKLSLTLRPAQN